MVRSHMFPHAVGPGRAEPEPGWYWGFFLYKKGSFSIQDVRPPEQVLRELLDLQIAQLGALPVVAKDDDVRPYR